MPTLEDLKKIIGALSERDRAHLFQWIRETGGETDWQVREAAFEYVAQFGFPRLTVEEYLALDESDVRYEYVAGRAYAMAGGTAAHAAITGNVFAAIHAHLGNGPCRAFIENMKLHLEVGHGEVFYYPDIWVFCGRWDPERQYLENPKLIVEVLSPSTERVDCIEKAANYWQTADLEEYVLISQKRVEVTIQRRAPGLPTQLLTLRSGLVELQSIGLTLGMERIYKNAGVEPPVT